jgi:hypothetical protein
VLPHNPIKQTSFSNDNPSWKSSHRLRLHQITRATQTQKQLLDGTQLDLSKINLAWFDVEFVGKPIQCEPSVCEELERLIHFQERVGHEQANLYKYALDGLSSHLSSTFPCGLL